MAKLATRTLGRTGLEVTRLGYGAMELLGEQVGRKLSPGQAEKILNAVLDGGINFIDTAPDYGESEELIGRFLARRRGEFFLASKCGCPVNYQPPKEPVIPAHSFTPENLRAAVEQSLRRLRTDHLDLVQVHMSPSRQVLEESRSLDALLELQKEQKVRFLGMSGTLPHLPDHIAMGVFDVFQIPYSALEHEHEGLIREAARAGAGTVIRGGVARGAPAGPDRNPITATFWRQRMEQRRALWAEARLAEILEGLSPMEFMLRFTLTHPDAHTVIVGTSDPGHLAENLRSAGAGPLPGPVYAEACRRLDAARPRG